MPHRYIFGCNFWKHSLAFSCPALFLLATSFFSAAADGQRLAKDPPPQPPIIVSQSKTGFDVSFGDERSHLTVCSDSIMHFMSSPEASTVPADKPKPQAPWMLDEKTVCPGAPFQFKQDAKRATLTTEKLKVEFLLDTGNIIYSTRDGIELLREHAKLPRTYDLAEVNGEKTYHVEDRFDPDSTEGIYGLGQHQSGVFNYRGSTVLLGQNNTDSAIPFFISTKGYGVIWNTASLSLFDNRLPLFMNISSLAANGIDYYLMYGPEMDQVIHRYRDMTGHAPMPPKWALGFIQSRDRYDSLTEITGIVDRMRKERIPIDGVVQDWYWWVQQGDPVFNKNYPDNLGQLKNLHNENIHAMITMWALMDPISKNFTEMQSQHMDIPKTNNYDPSNPDAMNFYFDHLAAPLLKEGWDAFWLDSSEPGEGWPHSSDAILQNKQMYMGSGARYTNIFPLLHNEGVADRWKKLVPDKRVMILTRSAFLGQQRIGSIVWSGDIWGTYRALRQQVPAGLNFALSGMPYWTTDAGGYYMEKPRPTSDPNFQDMYERWFEFAAFCPVFRTHGHREANEMWSYTKVEPTLIAFDKLRYRLMPYIYSLAWKVSSDDYTIMRPLVMDWRTDMHVRDTTDQYMFGPSLLVNPVVTEGATHRTVYLPPAEAWYDFWTGASLKGGQEIVADAPHDRLPLYVRAGSILPLGPEIQYTTEKLDAPVDLRIYGGANGDFTLYDDAGDGYGYANGAQTTIALHWDDASGTLTIGARQGTYPGMAQQQRFRLHFVSKNEGVGFEDNAFGKEVTYTGAAIKVSMR
jgi:alpha-D-xyloside xylohydrolase